MMENRDIYNRFIEKYIIEEELLLSLYWGNQYTIEEISELFSCTYSCILRKMNKYKIKRRKLSIAMKLSGPNSGNFKKGQPKSINWYHLKGEKHPKIIIIEKELLISLYYGNDYSTNEISKLFNCTPNTIINKRKLYNIERKYKNSKKTREGCKGELNIWRNKVYKRDNYTCQKCGKKGVYLNAHHIKFWALYPKERFKIENGITLCRKCHKNIHFPKKSA